MQEIGIQLLGNTVLRCAGTTHRITSPKLRVVLALLVSAPEQVRTVEMLTDEMWRTPPAHAVTTMQTYLYQLRRQLDAITPGGSDYLVTHPARYQTVFPTETVDVLRFESEACAGLQALADCRPEQAVTHLGTALSNWRGEPFADVPMGRGLAAVAARLRELHELAEISMVDAEMLCGRHHEVLPVLRGMVAEHPLSEGHTARLMVALARAGRPDEATATYDRLRVRLADELGLAPVSRLRRINDALSTPHLLPEWDALRCDERRDGEEDRAVVTQHLPAPSVILAGRTTEIAEIAARLTGAVAAGSQIVALHGPSGIGKTALAMAVARQVGHRFPDGLLVVDLCERAGAPRSVPSLLRQVLDHLGADGVGCVDADLLVTYRTWSAARRVLLVLDNAHSTDQVAALLPTGAGSAVVVCSGTRLGGLAGARHYTLDVLDDASSTTVLQRSMGPRWAEQDEEAAAEVARRCHGLPAAVQAVAHVARAELLDAGALRDLVEDEDQQWERVSRAVPRLVERVERCWQRLDAETRRAWTAFSALTMPFDIAEAARLLDLTELQARAVINRLREAAVLREYPAGDGHRFGLHDRARQHCLRRPRFMAGEA